MILPRRLLVLNCECSQSPIRWSDQQYSYLGPISEDASIAVPHTESSTKVRCIWRMLLDRKQYFGTEFRDWAQPRDSLGFFHTATQEEDNQMR